MIYIYKFKDIKRKKNINNFLEKTKIIASSKNTFNIELVEQLGEQSVLDIINISKDLKSIYGPNSLLNESNIHKYFNEETLPFIARHQNKIIGFIIGAPLEKFNNQSWVHHDDNLNKKNTLYTCAFIFKKEFRKINGFSKTLKKVYTSWAKKRNFKYITGHVNKNINLSGDIKILKEFPKWFDSKEPFIYYRKKI
tara:strand:+ start:48 stop:632 length:585 start_codon:yes stop_codon:yes gene_type:complete